MDSNVSVGLEFDDSECAEYMESYQAKKSKTDLIQCIKQCWWLLEKCSLYTCKEKYGAIVGQWKYKSKNKKNRQKTYDLNKIELILILIANCNIHLDVNQ